MGFTVSKGRSIYYEPQDALKEFFLVASWWQEKQRIVFLKEPPNQDAGGAVKQWKPSS